MRGSCALSRLGICSNEDCKSRRFCCLRNFPQVNSYQTWPSSFFAIDSHGESVLKFISFGQNQNLKISTAKATKDAKESTANQPEHAHHDFLLVHGAGLSSFACKLGCAG